MSDHGPSQAVEAGPNLREWLAIYVKGAAMGAADAVPGVSGGTIALITGIYERLIAALTALNPRVLPELLSVHTSDGRAAVLAEWRRMDLSFLVLLGLGVATSIIVLSRVVHAALAQYRAATFAFFLGLIAASAVVLYSEIEFDSIGEGVAGVAGFLLAFWLAGVTSGGALGHSLPIIFGAGALSVTATVLPGISGAFILLLIGQYDYLTGVLKRAVDGLIGLVSGDGTAGLAGELTVVATFLVGAATGVLSIAHVIRWALANYRAATLTFLVSLMAGSLRLPILEVEQNVETWDPTVALGITGAALIGAGAVLLLDHYTDDLDYTGESAEITAEG